jgi:hypothetical protein
MCQLELLIRKYHTVVVAEKILLKGSAAMLVQSRIIATNLNKNL